MTPLVVFTIGHSTRTTEAFIRLLKALGAPRVLDVRTIPRSRHNLQFDRGHHWLTAWAQVAGYPGHISGRGRSIRAIRSDCSAAGGPSLSSWGRAMLRNVKELRGYAIRATDGVIGKVDDLYFDDEDWGIRYLVVETGSWLSGRKVLISPIALGHAGWMGRQLPVALTRAQVERSPDIDTRKPVSRQHEAQYFGYYGYPYYWGGAGLWGMGAYPGSLTAQGRIEEDVKAHGNHTTPTPDDCHLRSSNAIIGHHIKAMDGDIGHLEDLLVDDHTWAIRYLIVNTSNWWSGQRVLVAPTCIKDVSWSEAKVSLDLTRQGVRDLPLYESMAQLESRT